MYLRRIYTYVYACIYMDKRMHVCMYACTWFCRHDFQYYDNSSSHTPRVGGFFNSYLKSDPNWVKIDPKSSPNRYKIVPEALRSDKWRPEALKSDLCQ